jgi:hypothetical protein
MVKASLLCIGMTLLAVVLLSAQVPATQASEPQTAGQGDLVLSWPGEINCDFDVDASDALYLLQYIVRLIPFEGCLRGADINCDGLRDARDVFGLLRFSAALPAVHPAGCPPIGPQLNFQYGVGITEPEADLVEQAAGYTTSFFEANFGVSTQAFEIMLDPDLDALAIAYSDHAAISFDAARQALEEKGVISDQTAIFIYKPHAVWAGASSDFERQGIIVRELMHILQHALVGLPGAIRAVDNQVPYGGPRWLMEGAASYVQQVVVFGQKNLLPCGALQSTAALQTMETWTGLKADSNGVALGSLAINTLHDLVDIVGTESLANFWFRVGEGETWQDAFEGAFSRTIAQWYVEFDNYRDELCS